MTIDDLEKKILEAERAAEEEMRKHAILKDYENASSSDDSIDSFRSNLTKKDSVNLKHLFEKQFAAAKIKPDGSADTGKELAKEPAKPISEKQPNEGPTSDKPKEAPKPEIDEAHKQAAALSTSKEHGKVESPTVKAEESPEPASSKSPTPAGSLEAKKVEKIDKKPDKDSKMADNQSSKSSKNDSDLKPVDSLQVTNFETTKFDLESSKGEQKKTPTGVSFSSSPPAAKKVDSPPPVVPDPSSPVSSPPESKSDSLEFFQNIKSVKSLPRIKEFDSKTSDSKSLEMTSSTPTNPLPNADQVDKKTPANPQKNGNESAPGNPKDQTVARTKSDSKSLRLASTSSDNSAASVVTLKMMNFMDPKDKEVKSISQYIDPKEMAKLEARMREMKPKDLKARGLTGYKPETTKTNAPSFDTSRPNLNPKVNPQVFEKLNLGTGITPPTSPSQSMDSSFSQASSEASTEEDSKDTSFRDKLPEATAKTELEATMKPPTPDLSGVKPEPAEAKMEAKAESKDTFYLLERLPMNVLKLLFSLLKNQDIITFIKAHRKCQNLMNQILKETVVVSQNFNWNEPFLLNLFQSKEHVNHATVLSDARVRNLQRRDYPSISDQIRKLITNEIGKSLETFANLEHLEIIESSEAKFFKSFNEPVLALTLKQLKVFNFSAAEPEASFVFSLTAPHLTAVKLVNFKLLKLSNYDSVTCLDVDEYDKGVHKFPNLTQLACTNLDLQNGLLKKNSKLRQLRLVHVERKILMHLLKRKKDCNLARLRIIVQGIKVDGLNQTVIMRDVTTFYGEMRIYLKYIRRLVTLDFLTNLVVNFDLKCLNKSLLSKLTNLKSVEVNFNPSDAMKWLQLLSASKVLQSISINVPIAQPFLDLLPEGCPNCMQMNLRYTSFPEKFSLKFLAALPCITSIQVNKELSTSQVLAILQSGRLRFLKEIKFFCGPDPLNIGFNRFTSVVKLDYQGRKLLINKQDFRNQLLLAKDWSWFWRESNFQVREIDQKSLPGSSTPPGSDCK